MGGVARFSFFLHFTIDFLNKVLYNQRQNIKRTEKERGAIIKNIEARGSFKVLSGSKHHGAGASSYHGTVKRIDGDVKRDSF